MDFAQRALKFIEIRATDDKAGNTHSHSIFWWAMTSRPDLAQALESVDYPFDRRTFGIVRGAFRQIQIEPVG
ncbi:MAG TPA: hypothetical protein PKN13_12985 [Accumulibacter sp.]|nr:hypothetical protein [Accumulibacter sp.]HMW18508.1 hypothetical protein [Accumulibacter sp.]HMX23675.1 hypothetical protein [Accumulibacter sp.]HMY06417.1 hypothetical protein [Accumulibacter sp.]HNC19229.1 hypothetical protein [Accumulibacter sp.]